MTYDSILWFVQSLFVCIRWKGRYGKGLKISIYVFFALAILIASGLPIAHSMMVSHLLNADCEPYLLTSFMIPANITFSKKVESDEEYHDL